MYLFTHMISVELNIWIIINIYIMEKYTKVKDL